jgi:hypothetical protein
MHSAYFNSEHPARTAAAKNKTAISKYAESKNMIVCFTIALSPSSSIRIDQDENK